MDLDVSEASTEPCSPDQSECSDIIPILVEGKLDEEEGSQAQVLAAFEVSRLCFVALGFCIRRADNGLSNTTGILTTNLAR